MFKILLALALVVFGVGMVVTDLHETRDASAFRSRGETARVESITNILQHEETRRRSREVTRRYETGDVTFKTKAGESVTVDREPLPPNAMSNMRSRAGLTLWYLPDRPTTVRFRSIDEASPSNPMATRLIGLLVAALGVVLGVRVWRSR